METTARGVRIRNDSIEKIKEKCRRRKCSFNAWINWAVSVGLRSHRKKELLEPTICPYCGTNLEVEKEMFGDKGHNCRGTYKKEIRNDTNNRS